MTHNPRPKADINAIIFDLGNVFVNVHYDIFFKKIQRVSDPPADEIARVMSPEKILFDKGQIPKETFYENIRQKLHLPIGMDTFFDWWNQIFSLDENMVDLGGKLSKNYQTFLLTNIDEIHYLYLKEKYFSKLSFLRDLMLSFEVGYCKPERRIYAKCLNKFKVKPERGLFIDDKKENVEAASEIGFSVLHHLNYEDTLNQLRQMGIKM